MALLAWPNDIYRRTTGNLRLVNPGWHARQTIKNEWTHLVFNQTYTFQKINSSLPIQELLKKYLFDMRIVVCNSNRFIKIKKTHWKRKRSYTEAQLYFLLVLWSKYFTRTWSISLVVMPLEWRHNGHDSVSNHQPLFTQLFIRAQTKENIKAPRHWPLCGEFTGDRWIPRTKGQ